MPDNHNFGWWESFQEAELNRYVEHHRKMGDAVKIDPQKLFPISQVLMFFQRESSEFEIVKEKLSNAFPDLSLIKTSSPLHTDYIWMEIFPNGVSKAQGIEEICRITGISRECTLGIGNDFNDLEMLDFTEHSYVVENAPDELKNKYMVSRAHYDNGFSHAVNNHLK